MLADLLVRIRSLFRRRRVEEELDDELRFHFEHEVEKHIAAGVDPEEARRKARLVFGGMEQLKEECRQARGVSLIENLVQDTRLSLRTLIKAPGFAAGTIVTLALGVAATTAAFSVVDSILLNPVPFKDADRLVEIYQWGKTGGGPRQPQAMLGRWREQTQIFEAVEAHAERPFALTADADPEVILSSRVTVGLFRFLGVPPRIGRDFASDESSARVAIIGDSLWRRRFGSDPAIAGKTIHLDDDAYTIIGVMPSWFRFPLSNIQVWTPLMLNGNPQTTPPIISQIGKLRPGLPLEQADSAVATLAPQLNEALAKTPGTTARIAPISRFATNGFLAKIRDVHKTRTVLFLILAAAGLVLLASCANSANLFLSRGLARSRETAVRAAIGCSRLRLTCHVLVEAVVIAFIAGSLGLLIAAWSLRVLEGILPRNLVEGTLHPLALDMRVVLWAASASLVSAIIAAVVPSLRAARGDINHALQGRSTGRGRQEARLRGLLIATETALAFILMVGAGLLGRSLWTLMHVDQGWSTDDVVVVEPHFSGTRYSDAGRRIAMLTQIAREVGGIPGVEGAAISYQLPQMPSDISFGTFETEAGSVPELTASVNRVSDSYFKTLGIPMYSGRTFSPADSADSVIITRQLAQRLWPNGDAVGKRMKMNTVLDWVTVVAVVGDVQTFGFDIKTDPFEIYLPFQPNTTGGRMNYVSVGTKDRTGMTEILRSRIRQLDPNLPVDIRPVKDIYAANLADPIFNAMLIGGFAFLTVLLAVAGVYATVTYEVSRRTQEIGIRVALGATRQAITTQIMKSSLAVAGIGAAAGLAASVAVTRLMTSMLYAVRPTDPLTFVLAALQLIGCVVVAAYWPARRASSVDPAITLRNE